MNQEKFVLFSIAYKQGLREAVEADRKKPIEEREYGFGPDQANAVAERMLKAIAENPKSVNYLSSHGFKCACKALGIKHTVKAILGYLEAL